MVAPTALPTSHYTAEQSMLQFCGIVDSITSHGIQITNLAYGTKNFFFHPHIVGIVEEQVLNDDDPQVEIIKEAAKKEQDTVVKLPPNYDQNQSAFMDIKTLQNLAAHSKAEINKRPLINL